MDRSWITGYPEAIGSLHADPVWSAEPTSAFCLKFGGFSRI
jgi:hypothetical protein